MRYLFREVTHEGYTIRYIKPPDFDSNGPVMTTKLAELQVLSQYMEFREPRTIVIALLGCGAIGCSNNDTVRGPILYAFHKKHVRLPDKYYEWKAAEIVID